MQLHEVVKCIQTHTLPNFLIFTGSEYAIANLYIEQICKKYNLCKQNINTVAQVVKKQRVISLTGENKLYVCRYDFDFIKTELTLPQINKIVGDKNILILVLPSLDKRSKFYKNMESCIVEFNEQDYNTVITMLKGKINLSKDNLFRLITGCGVNYSKILLEIDKIKTLSSVYSISEDKAYEKIVNDGTIYEIQDTKLQEFVDCVMKKDRNCFNLYKSLLDNGESNITIIAWLYNAVRNQLSVQTTQRPSQETTGLNYYFIKECLDRKGYYSNKELLNLLNTIKNTEQGIKQGLIDEPVSVSYIMVNAL